jgi:hypothetical protein
MVFCQELRSADGLISNAIAIAVIAKAEIPHELRTKP